MTAAPAGRPLSRHLADLCGELAAATPDAPALIAGDQTLSYAELEARAGTVAAGLVELGVRRGSCVGLLCVNRWEWLVAALAAMRLGARVAAFNTFAKAWDLDHMLSHSRAELLVTLDRFRGRDYLETIAELVPGLERRGWRSQRFPQLREIVAIGDAPQPAGVRRFGDLLATPGPAPAVEGSAADDAFALYTSGSTARPKAVPLQHYAAIENGYAIGERMELTAADRVWLPVPLFWAYGAVNALPAALTHGAALVLQEAFEPVAALDLIERHSCTVAYTLPNITNAVLAAAGFEPSRTRSLRTGLTLGTPVDIRRAAEQLGAERICNIYGGTETYGNCCVTPASWPLERRLESQGPPLPGFELRIWSERADAPAPPGEVGEIHVRGYLTRGYLDDDGGANAAFGDDGWYRSGDLASLDAQGCLHFAARATEMIKTGGINVAPLEVEEFLALHPAVRAAAVVGVADAALGEVGVAAVVLEPGHDASPDELRRFCSERIAAYKVPARIHVVDELPKTDTGKLARRQVVELDASARKATA